MLDWYMYIYFKFFRSRLDFKFSVSKIMNGILYNNIFKKNEVCSYYFIY